MSSIQEPLIINEEIKWKNTALDETFQWKDNFD